MPKISSIPDQGQLVQVRSRPWVVNQVKPSSLPSPSMELPGASTQNVLTSSVEDDCLGYDLVVCDEASKLAASFFGGEVKYTRRYQLGQLVSVLTRNFLLMTATPQNGKEEDFQLILALLDGDRFEGKFRDGMHQIDTSDLMRRMVKENLLKFDGTPLFPERIAEIAA